MTFMSAAARDAGSGFTTTRVEAEQQAFDQLMTEAAVTWKAIAAQFQAAVVRQARPAQAAALL